MEGHAEDESPGAASDPVEAEKATGKRPREKKRCQYEGCNCITTDSGRNKWCTSHQGGKPNLCIVKGCKTFQKSRCRPYCHKHRNHEYDETLEANEPNETERVEWELTHRRKRDRRLREKMLPIVGEEQGHRCASSLKTCEVVKNGKATDECPMGERRVPWDAQDLDHIKRVADGGGDERENLQMLCAYCHALKSRREGRAEFGDKYFP